MPRKAIALLLSSHPGPTAIVTIVGLLLGIALGYPPARLVVLTLTVLGGQLSIGWSNDWLDARRDASVHRSDKPVARGELTPSVVRTAAFVAFAASILLSLILGPLAALASFVLVSMGWLYNLGLKNSVLSVVPFVISFGLLPAVATLGLEPPSMAPWWALGAGSLLGVAAHLTNVLPDLEDDRATGVRGFPHAIGARASGILAFVCLVGAGALIALAAGPPRPITIIGLGIGLVLGIIGVVLVLQAHRTRLLMRLIMAGAVIDVVMLTLSGQSL
jgi:4-hydroxybenzoate polyprenyltransferase